jgi:hypothetical protein
MAMRDGKGKWWVAGVGLGILLIGLGVFLLRAGLEDADRWGSVFGVFLNIAGLAVTVYSAVWAQRAAASPRPGANRGEVTNQIRGGQFTSLVLQGRDMHAGPATASPDQPGAGNASAGAVYNRIEDGTFGAPVIQGRDMHGVLPPPRDAGTQPGQQEQPR